MTTTTELARANRKKYGIHTEVDDVPCIVICTSYSPGDPGRMYGAWENCYPPEPPECEWELYDENGDRAEWLEDRLTDDDIERIDELVIANETRAQP